MDAKSEKHGDTWVAKLPVRNVDDYAFAFANIRYKGDIVISSDFTAAIPSRLGMAVATKVEAPDGSDSWTDVEPAEGPGGIKGMRPLINSMGTTCKQFDEPHRKAPGKE